MPEGWIQQCWLLYPPLNSLLAHGVYVQLFHHVAHAGNPRGYGLRILGISDVEHAPAQVGHPLIPFDFDGQRRRPSLVRNCRPWHVLCALGAGVARSVGLHHAHGRLDKMAMQRWDPFGEMMSLREAMDRLLQDSFVRPAGQMLGGRGSVPLDLAESDDTYVVQATMPGVNPDDLQISIQGDQLTIRGDMKAEEKREGQNWIVRERRSSSFHRTVTLPSPVNADQAQARYENGVLTLTLPKAAQARPKQIKIQGATGNTLPNQGRANMNVDEAAQRQAQMPGQQGAAAQGPTTGQRDQYNRATNASEQSFPASDAPRS